MQQLTPFYQLLGLEVLEREDGRSAVRLPYRAEFGNSRGDVHGGALSSLMDVTMSQALRSKLSPQAKIATIDLNIHYLAPGRGDVVGHGNVVRLGKSIATVEARIVGPDETCVACGLATFRILSP